ncbi:ABC transporter substrate-binding protein [Spirochaeta isovalerica]|uniref:NitT/TauT family transport system substrate-binding protein n=1 Tax=Spirochaeta isovalerica TaxID=150 RepID=A0A841RE82_9SPIO|nr:ABC transporter substrate-binding protein [Spirochaeta isovalerica]MBB6481926.1 NitT/TauT family transport system substrate-binding protein [Spirochaeta isovalerica]
MNKNTLTLFILISLIISPLTAKGAREEYPENFTVKATALNGPTGIGMIYLFDEQPDFGEGVSVEYSVALAPKNLMGDLAKKSIDMAVLPANMPALLHAKAPGYKVAAVTGMGNLYIVSRDPSIGKPSDLVGKTLFNGAKGATPDFMTRYLLTGEGIDADKDLYMDFSYGLPDLAKAVIGGLADTAVFPEPYITMITEKSDAEIVIDLQQWWMDQKGTDESYPLSVFVVKEEILESYPLFVERFLKAYQDSIKRVTENPSEAALLVTENGFTMAADVTEKAIPRLNLKYTDGEAARDMLTQYYGILYEMDPATVGGSVPGDDLYYIEK